MRVSFFDLQRQYQSLGHDIRRLTEECLTSCAYVEGPMVKEFESLIGAYLGVKYTVSCGSGTDALELALRAVGVKPGDEVITTPFTFFATAEAIAAVGAVPVFADVKADDYCINPEKIEPLITGKTRAILPVHIFGAPCDMDSIHDIAKRHNLKVVEDACQAIGAVYNGRRVGGLSDAGCFSFYPTKNLGACGDGGLIATNDPDVALNCSALKAHGAGKLGAQAYAQMNGVPMEMIPGSADDAQPLYDPYKYYNYLIAKNSRLDSIQAAVLQAKLPHLNEMNNRRAAIAKQYLNGLQQLPLALPHFAGKNSLHCWHQFAVMSEERAALAAALSARGIGTGAFYPVPLHLQKAFSYLGYKEGALPVAEELCRRSVCLPIFPELTDDEVAYVVESIQSFYLERA